MAISDKLTYLIETKSQLRTAINDIGGNLTTEDTFRSYVNVLNNIYDYLPKVTGTGTSITLENTTNGGMRITLKASELEQTKTTQGKNLIDISRWTYVVGNLQDNGNIAANENYITYEFINLTDLGLSIGDDIAFSIKNNYTSGTTTRRFQIYDSSNNVLINKNLNASSTATIKTTLTIPENAVKIRFSARITDTEIQLEKGSSATSYEPFVPNSPSPEYPQDIHTINGDNSVVVNGKNLLGQDNISSLSTATGTYNGDTLTFTSTATYKKVEWFIPAKVGDTFTFSCGGNDTLYLGIFEYSRIATDSNYRLRAIAWDTAITTNGKTQTFTIQNNCYLRVYLGSQPVTTTTISNIMLEKGSTATEYEEYKEQTAPLNLPVENLFDKDNYNLVNLFPNASNTFDSGWRYSTIYVACKPNTTYTISRKVLENNFVVATSPNIPVANGSTTNRIANNSSTSITITTGANDNYLSVYVKYEGDTTYTIEQILDSIMIEKGTKTNSYTPYGTIPIEYCKIGDYEDEFILTSGKNLYPITATSGVFQGITQTINDNTITLKGTASTTAGERIFEFIPENGKTYTIHIESSNFPTSGLMITVQNYNNNTYVSQNVLSSSVTSYTFTYNSSDNYNKIAVRWQVNSGVTVNNVSIRIQTEYGSIATSYEPYGTNQWYLKKNIGKVVLDGVNNKFTYQNQSQYPNCLMIPYNDRPRGLADRNSVMSTHFQIQSGMPTTPSIGWSVSTQMWVNNDGFTSLEAGNNWLINNNTIVYYVLATPTYTQITGTLETQLENIYKNMLSYKGQTNISQINNDLPFVLGVSALKELEETTNTTTLSSNGLTSLNTLELTPQLDTQDVTETNIEEQNEENNIEESEVQE